MPENSVESGKSIDFTKLCRVCMKEKMYMKPLFDSDSANYHGKKISEIIGRAISPEDGLPQLICQYCLVQLMDMIKIKNIAIESNKKMIKLREALSGFFYDGNDSDEKTMLSEFQYQIHSESNGKYMKKFDVNSMCRICMGEKHLMTSIFYTSPNGCKNGPDLSTRITEVTDSQIYLEDGMSSSICAFCRTSIIQAWDFIQKVLGSDSRFREILFERRD